MRIERAAMTIITRHDDGTRRACTSRSSGYVTGFVLSVILTAIPFWLVMGDVLDKPSDHGARRSWRSRRCRSSCT